MNGRRLLQLITTLTLLGCEDQAGSPIEEPRWAEVVVSSMPALDLVQAARL